MSCKNVVFTKMLAGRCQTLTWPYKLGLGFGLTLGLGIGLRLGLTLGLRLGFGSGLRLVLELGFGFYDPV